MNNYKKAFEGIELEPCELVAIRKLAVDYKKRLLEKYHVENERELRREIEKWSTYEEVVQYYHLVISNRLIKKIPEVPQEILEQGFLAETDNVVVGNKEKTQRKGDNYAGI